MKKALLIAISIFLALLTVGCGNNIEDMSENQSNSDKLEKPIVLLDNDVVKIEIIELFEEQSSYRGKNTIEKGFTTKTTNKTDEIHLFQLVSLYIGEEQMDLVCLDTLAEPPANKTSINSFYIRVKDGKESSPLDDINRIYELEGEVRMENRENNRWSFGETFNFSLTDK